MINDNWKQTNKAKTQRVEFAQAQNVPVKRREPSTGINSESPRGISLDEIDEDLLKVVQLLEGEKTPASMKSIKTILKKIPATYADFIPAWKDNNNMDLFHHVIINNWPDIVEFLLGVCNWFPATHMPYANPYAHVAAMFGHTECLRLILNYRPNDYFSGLSHTLKLPTNIRKKVKYNDTINKGMKRQINKLLGRIQSTADTVEMAILKDKTSPGDMNDVSNTLADDLKQLEASKKELDRGIRRIKHSQFTSRLSTAGNTIRKHDASNFATVPSISIKKHISKDYGDAEKVHVAKEGGGDDKHAKYQKYQNLPMGKAIKKHVISVYCDELSDAPLGVVRGAGQKVIVKYCEGATKPKRESMQLQGSYFLTRNASISPAVSSPRKMSKVIVEKTKPVQQEHRGRAESVILPRIVEPGIRGNAKYKDFQLKIESRKIYPKDNSKSLRNKTPLSLAAEYGHLECVQMILDTHILRNHPTTAVKGPLTLATKAKSPDTILFLMNQRLSIPDYQCAVLTAIREMYPDCLTALLAQKSKERHSLFDGVNLYHILYTQSLMSDYRYEMLPVMTNVLISNNEDVNAHNVYCTFPMYTLINCAFHISIGKQIFFYLNCLKMLLDKKANPHYDELKDHRLPSNGQSFARSAYSSAINCILENAVNSTNYFENIRSSKIFMKKLISTVITFDKTSRRILNEVLFNYMNTICLLGIDRYIVKCLLRYGANPDVCHGKKYPINMYFDNILPYLAKFQMEPSYIAHEQEISALMALCRSMNYKCLKEAQVIFLNDNLLQCPIQALPLFRYFSYGLNKMLMSPRSLTQLVGQFIWFRLRRNEKRVKALPLPEYIISIILP